MFTVALRRSCTVASAITCASCHSSDNTHFRTTTLPDPRPRCRALPTHSQAPGRGCGARSTEPRCPVCALLQHRRLRHRIHVSPSRLRSTVHFRNPHGVQGNARRPATDDTAHRETRHVTLHSTGCHHYCEPTIRSRPRDCTTQYVHDSVSPRRGCHRRITN